MALFHFALREGGILLLGDAETVSGPTERFTAISKAERIYRHVGRSGRPSDCDFPGGDGVRISARPGSAFSPSRQTVYAELCRRVVLESHAPAAVLINRKNECLFSLGPTDRYLALAPGAPTHDLLAWRARVFGPSCGRRSIALFTTSAPIVVSVVGGAGRPELPFAFRCGPSPATARSLRWFALSRTPEPRAGKPRVADADIPRVAELERELEATRIGAGSRNPQSGKANEEHKAINEEALSVNEEFQSTNEELLTSKEELQSLNEELTALNGQLQETLDRQRTTSDDLQNVLYSTDVATIFLDLNLNIRFFTPATKSLFNVFPAMSDARWQTSISLADDGDPLPDARSCLSQHLPMEREIETPETATGICGASSPIGRRHGGVEGVVITFVDITERKRTLQALQEAKRQAEQADSAKSRFLAAASHDLRQPLQTLTLLQGLLARSVELRTNKEHKFVARIGETLGGMTGHAQCAARYQPDRGRRGAVHMASFPVDDLLNRLCAEFGLAGQSKRTGLAPRSLRIVGSQRSPPSRANAAATCSPTP